MNDKNYNITIDANVSTDDREILEKVGTTILDERNRARKSLAECLREEGPPDIASIRYVNDGIDTRWELENGEFFEPYILIQIISRKYYFLFNLSFNNFFLIILL